MNKETPGNSRNEQQHDAETIEGLFRLYYNPLCNYCRGITGEREVAEDIVQDVFAYLWDHRDSIDMTVSIKAYLYAAVRNGALKFLRKQATEQAHSPRLTEFIAYLQELKSPEQEHLIIEKIRQALDELPGQCRAIFLMNCLEEKKYKEIAVELGISVNTVKTQLSRAYASIRKKVGIKGSLLLFLLYRRRVLGGRLLLPRSREGSVR
ncbi:MAG: RNA polymerase sigma-70 factor [Odoribacteraceae bacterium]|jgi:RNA polymerase sigma-70 factor (ECF subfamily)|nr:RNA polymerase sigma-70 factor [Odoribacteraceae bacterium]